MSDVPTFRAPKRRRVTTNHPTRTENIDHEDEVEADSIIRVRRQTVTKRSGVQFSNHAALSRGEHSDESKALKPAGDASQKSVGGLQNRFIGAGEAIQVVNDDQNMMDFVDRAMASRTTPSTSRLRNSTTRHEPEGSDDGYTSLSDDEENRSENLVSARGSDVVPRDRSAKHLSEVDLGPSSTSSNLARTTATMTGHEAQKAAVKPARRRKPRLGRDGKPLRPRPHRGPNADDFARGLLVEQVLQEHGLGTYDARKAATKRTGQDEAADERMATDFQQQFLDAVIERQERNQQRQAQSSSVKKETGMAAGQGPRLGGSRSARAKMAAVQSAAATEKT